MKKIISLLMALTMLALCACGQNDQNNSQNVNQDSADKQTGDTAPYGLYYENSGLPTAEAVMTVNGNEIPADLYCYLADYNCSNLSNEILAYYSYYGAYAECVNEEDFTINWDGKLYEDRTLGQYARFLTEDSLKFYAIVENMAAEYGVTLTDEDISAMEASFASTTAAQGGEDVFEQSLAEIGFRRSSFERLISSSYLFNRMTELVAQEGSALYLDPASYSQYAAYADHILLATVDLSTGEALSEEEIAAKRATAEDLLSQLQAVEGEERMTLFAKLADEHSEDTGRQTNPNGYIFGHGEMVESFEEAAFSLQPGEISGIVESTYGMHIILGKDLLVGLETDEEQKQAILENHLTSLIQLEADQAEVVFSESMDSFDIGAFYQGYTADAQALAEEKAAAEEGENAGDEPSEGNAAGDEAAEGSESRDAAQ